MFTRRCAHSLVSLGFIVALGAAGCDSDEPTTEARAQVDGSLDKEVIRRVVRAHIDEVRYCYNQGLSSDPELAGRVAVRFVIGSEGDVEQAELQDSTLDDKAVATCIAEAVEDWTFPKPSDGGDVTVTYPFVLSPG